MNNRKHILDRLFQSTINATTTTRTTTASATTANTLIAPLTTTIAGTQVESYEKITFDIYSLSILPIILIVGVLSNIIFIILLNYTNKKQKQTFYRQQKHERHHRLHHQHHHHHYYFRRCTKMKQPLRYLTIAMTISDIVYLLNELNAWSLIKQRYNHYTSINGICQLYSYFYNYFSVLNECHLLAANFILLNFLFLKRNTLILKQDSIYIYNSRPRAMSLCQATSYEPVSNSEYQPVASSSIIEEIEEAQLTPPRSDSPTPSATPPTDPFIVAQTAHRSVKFKKCSDSSIESPLKTKIKTTTRTSLSAATANATATKPSFQILKLDNRRNSVNQLNLINYSNLVFYEKLTIIFYSFIFMYLLSFFLWIQGVITYELPTSSATMSKIFGTSSSSAAASLTQMNYSLCETYTFARNFLNYFLIVFDIIKLLTLLLSFIIAIFYIKKFNYFLINFLRNTFNTSYESATTTTISDDHRGGGGGGVTSTTSTTSLAAATSLTSIASSSSSNESSTKRNIFCFNFIKCTWINYNSIIPNASTTTATAAVSNSFTNYNDLNKKLRKHYMHLKFVQFYSISIIIYTLLVIVHVFLHLTDRIQSLHSHYTNSNQHNERQQQPEYFLFGMTAANSTVQQKTSSSATTTGGLSIGSLFSLLDDLDRVHSSQTVVQYEYYEPIAHFMEILAHSSKLYIYSLVSVHLRCFCKRK